MPRTRRCTAMTTKNKRCKKTAKPDMVFCTIPSHKKYVQCEKCYKTAMTISTKKHRVSREKCKKRKHRSK